MPLLKDKKITADGWRELSDEASLPDHPQVIVSWERWQRDREILLQSNAELGLMFPNTEDPQLLSDDVARLKLIALVFPVFRDGRAFSQARILREELGFSGELRATGDLLQDQALFMLRCGFDGFLLPDGQDEEAWLKAMEDFSLWYQPTGSDGAARTIWQMRGKK